MTALAHKIADQTDVQQGGADDRIRTGTSQPRSYQRFSLRQATPIAGITDRASTAVMQDDQANDTAADAQNESVKHLDNAEVQIALSEPQPSRPRERFDIMQDWEGIVQEVTLDTFKALLRDRTKGEHYATEVATFPIADLFEDDLKLLAEGAVFHFAVGRLRRESGRLDRISRIVFRRLPAWSRQTLSKAKTDAEALAEYFRPAVSKPS